MISWFQSQTGSPSSSDRVDRINGAPVPCFNPKREAHPLQTEQEHMRASPLNGFNPKREAHPLQTERERKRKRAIVIEFQSQTGSPSSSDKTDGAPAISGRGGFNPKREAHPLQTACGGLISYPDCYVSIPNGKPILFRRAEGFFPRDGCDAFQSQTGSPSSSDSEAVPAPGPLLVFQSQTGSPSSSDRAIGHCFQSGRGVSIPNGKPILFRPPQRTTASQ